MKKYHGRIQVNAVYISGTKSNFAGAAAPLSSILRMNVDVGVYQMD